MGLLDRHILKLIYKTVFPHRTDPDSKTHQQQAVSRLTLETESLLSLLYTKALQLF